jgi:hypothetical protein
MLHPKDGSSPKQNLIAVRLQDGSIPEAMQWKKATVFSAAESSQPEFHEWLQALPGGLDTVKTQSWESPDPKRPDLYVLLGWSTSGSDELRRATVDSIVTVGRRVNVYVSRPIVNAQGGLMGTADMQFVGWQINLKDLPRGEYDAKLFMRRDTINIVTHPKFAEERIAGKGYQEVAKLEFAIKSAK